MGAGVKVTAFLAANREREIVTTRFALDPKIGAGAAPLPPMRRHPPPPNASLGQEMRQLVPQRAVDLGLSKSDDPAVEQNPGAVKLRASCGGAQMRRPFDANFRSDFRRAICDEQAAREGFEPRITARRSG